MSSRLFFLIACLIFSTRSACSSQGNNEISIYGSQIPSEDDYEINLKSAWENGDIEAGGQLIFAQALGVKMNQDLRNALSSTDSLTSLGATRAFTTLALLQNHNLTGEIVPDQERNAMSNYAIAAIKGDPLAQKIISNYYAAKNDCISALLYARKAASYAIKSNSEAMISRQFFVNYVLKEDNPIPNELLPTQDKLHYLDYIATNGDVDSALHAAEMYLGDTPGLKRDIPKALKMLDIAVKGNNTIAMIWLGQLYLRGMANIDGETAFELLQKAHEYGNPLAYSGLGQFYLEGKGGAVKSARLAEKYFKFGMEAGNVDAFYQMGKLYNSTAFNKTDEAAECWKLPAYLGHVHSMFHLAEYYYQKLTESSSSELSIPSIKYSYHGEISSFYCNQALPLYQTVALAGDWKELFDIAYADFVKGNRGSALLKYLLLSDMGYRAAHINAARIIEEGNLDIFGAHEDTLQAELVKLWNKVAQSGNAKGYTKMGNINFYSKNLTSAVSHYKKAFEAREAEGGFNYGLALEWGEGVEQNLSKARQIFNEVLNMNPDATFPVYLALARLDAIEILKNYTSIDIHNKSTYSKLTSFSFPEWDIIVILVLIIIIFVAIYYRRRQA